MTFNLRLGTFTVRQAKKITEKDEGWPEVSWLASEHLQFKDQSTTADPSFVAANDNVDERDAEAIRNQMVILLAVVFALAAAVWCYL